MKTTLTLLLLLFATVSFAQSCDGVVEISIDRFTGYKYVLSTKHVSVTNPGNDKVFLSGGVDREGSGNVYMYISLDEKSELTTCFDKATMVYMILSDSSRVKFATKQDMNCDGYARLYLPINKLLDLTTKRIVAMRFYTRDGHADFDLDTEQQKQLQTILFCLWKQRYTTM